MTTATPTAGGMTTVISAFEVMTSAGVGAEPFAAALAPGAAPVHGPVPGFATGDDSTVASRVRLADRPSAMALAAIASLLPDGAARSWDPARRALVLGSGAAGIDQSMTVTRDSLTRPRPDNVNPALVAACVMNYASAQAAIRFDLRGPNATVTCGRVTGLAALGYARRLLAAGRADAVICGAYEDMNERRTGIAAAAGVAGPAAEGCCVLLVESAERARAHGRPVLAEVLAVETGVFTEPGDAHDALRSVAERALRRAEAVPEDVGLVVPGGDEDPLPGARVVRPAEAVGDAFGAAAALQLAAAVIAGSRGTLALVTATDPDGHAGACLLRVADPGTRSARA